MSAPATKAARAPDPGELRGGPAADLGADLGADLRGELRVELLRRLAAAAEREVEAGEISAGDSLRDDLGLGSLDAILLVLELEEWLEIDVEDEELAALDTVGSLLELVESKVRAADRPTPS